MKDNPQKAVLLKEEGKVVLNPDLIEVEASLQDYPEKSHIEHQKAALLSGVAKQREKYEFLFSQYASWMYPKMPPDQRQMWGMEMFNFCFTMSLGSIMVTVLAVTPSRPDCPRSEGVKMSSNEYLSTLLETLVKYLDEKREELRKKTGMIATEMGLVRDSNFKKV